MDSLIPPWRWPRAARHLGVAWILRRSTLPPSPEVVATEALEILGEPVVLHRLERPAPEAWLASREIAAPSRDAGWQLLLDPSIEPGRDAVVPGALPGVRELPPGTLTLLGRGPSTWRLRVRTRGAGLLVLDQAFSGRWRASVDGEPTPVELVNLWQLGVRLPAGDHELRIWWDSAPFLWGLAAALVGLGLTLALLALPPSRDRRPPTGGAAPRLRGGPGAR